MKYSLALASFLVHDSSAFSVSAFQSISLSRNPYHFASSASSSRLKSSSSSHSDVEALLATAAKARQDAERLRAVRYLFIIFLTSNNKRAKQDKAAKAVNHGLLDVSIHSHFVYSHYRNSA
jgi:hypothetical protein